VQAVAIRREATRRRAVWLDPGPVGRMVAACGTGVVGDGVAAVVIRLSMADRIAPRKPLAAHAASGGLFPLRFGGQAVAIGTPVAGHAVADSGLISGTSQGVAGRESLLLAARIAPLEHVIP